MKNSYLIAWVLATSLLAGCGEKTETKTVVVSNSSVVSTNSNIQNFAISQQYSAPENSTEVLKWNLVVENGNVKSVQIENNWTTREARENIWNFSNSIESQIVWKPLKWMQIWKVGGASLSSSAFNEALKAINS